MPSSDFSGSFYGDSKPMSAAQLSAYNQEVANGLQSVGGKKKAPRVSRLEDLTKKDLIARAVKLNIPFTGKTNAQLISAIRQKRGQ